MIAFCSVVAIVVVLFVQVAVWLLTLPAGCTLVSAMVMVPVIAFFHYRVELRRPLLDFVRTHRAPLPPERFYWVSTQRRLLGVVRVMALTAPVWWVGALELPAAFVLSVDSVIGWLCGAGAIWTTGVLLSSSWLYTVAAQRVDSYLPWFIGAARRAMYRLSHNPDFL